MAKGSSYPALTNPALTDFVLGIDSTAVATKKLQLSTLAALVLQTAYPVGAIYHSTSATNPATILGFGTWAAFATGRTLVGKAASGTFVTAGATGGSETHVLSTSEMPSHNHGVNDPGHAHSLSRDVIATSGSGNSRIIVTGSGQQVEWSVTSVQGSGTGVSIQHNGGNAAHNNLQPYVVVYIWQRTA